MLYERPSDVWCWTDENICSIIVTGMLLRAWSNPDIVQFQLWTLPTMASHTGMSHLCIQKLDMDEGRQIMSMNEALGNATSLPSPY